MVINKKFRTVQELKRFSQLACSVPEPVYLQDEDARKRKTQQNDKIRKQAGDRTLWCGDLACYFFVIFCQQPMVCV